MAHVIEPGAPLLIDVVKRIKIQRLRWLLHVARMDSSNAVRKVSNLSVGLTRSLRMYQCWVSEIGEKLQQLVMYVVAN